jgi:prepilin-type N-terminal cleavage/methylation domain-containing protein
MHARTRTTGFTLVEVAIVLVILGLLLGGILKGQELVTNARVRELISHQENVKAAFFGFQDRYRALPGDFRNAVGTIVGATQNGNGNGRIEGDVTPNEAILAWEHMSRAGFLHATYTYNATPSNATNPVNRYGVYLEIIYDGNYGAGSPGTPSPLRHNIKTGSQIPVDIVAIVDRKTDDGMPNSGVFQFSRYQGNGASSPTDGTPAAPSCTSSTALDAVWNTVNGSTNCGGAHIF